MAKRAEFAERTYEAYANSEVAFGAPFSPGQNLEAIVGFDAAFFTPAPRALQRLGLRGPRGLLLRPIFNDPRLPGKRISLIVQYKRCEFVDKPARHTKQWKLWSKPYFRFELTKHQHEILLRLEESARRQAVIRYAAPAFWTAEELDDHRENEQVIEKSSFVSPAKIGTNHRWLTYDRPTLRGKPNQPVDDEGIGLQDWKSLLNELSEQAAEVDFANHILHVKNACDVSSEWVEDARAWLRYLERDDPRYRFNWAFGVFPDRDAAARYLALSRFLMLHGLVMYMFRFETDNKA